MAVFLSSARYTGISRQALFHARNALTQAVPLYFLLPENRQDCHGNKRITILENIATRQVYLPYYRQQSLLIIFASRPMKTHSPQRIAIIGGGFSGVVTALKLIEASAQPLDIVLFESTHEIGRGIAYSSANHEHLVNGPARLFGLYPHQPLHLVEWLTANALAYDWQPPTGVAFENSFPPRWIFGAYVQASLQAALLAAGMRIRLQTVQARVIDLQQSGTQYAITTASAGTWQADRVVLATGLFRPQAGQAFEVDAALAPAADGSARLIDDVWREGVWNDIERAASVLIIGSSLTALDAILSAEKQGFTGNYIAVSRRGLLVKRREDVEPWPDVLQPGKLPGSLRALLRTVQQARHAIRAGGYHWQRLPGAVRPHLPQLWANATARDKQRFLRHLRPYWEIALHRAAPESGNKFEKIVASGRYQQQSGRIVAVRSLDNGKIEVDWRDRSTQEVHSVQVDRVVNAQGYEFDWRKIDDALISNVLRRALVHIHATGFGIDTAADSGAVLDAAKRPSTRLFAVGHPVRGVVWESNSIPEQVAGATATAQAIAALIAQQTEHASEQATLLSAQA